jgi:P4 family phage/plasmid primase-like protien
MQELKNLPIWFLWRKEMDGDRINKVPFAAGGGATGTNDKYRHTWVTYEEAVAAAKMVGAAGVGFVIPEGYFFLDIDHADEDDPRVQTMLSRFDSYAEYSVSGNGLHIYGKVDLRKLPIAPDKNGKPRLDKQFYMKNPNNGIELYIGGLTNRFAVFTGNAVVDLPLKDCTTAVLTTLDKDMRKAEKVKYSASRDGDKELFDLVANLYKQKNGDKFIKLYRHGDYSDYGSHSEADLALCSMIAFRAGPDPALIDEVFRDSALMREKWEREDYRTATIDAAIRACNGQFHRSKMDHPYFILFDDEGNPFIKASLLAKWTREHLHYLLIRDNGKQGVLIYVYQDGVYKLYAPDMLKGVIKGYIADYDEEMVRMNPVNEAFNQIITDTNYISQSELNADEGIINFRNGLLSLKSGKLKLLPHSPEVYSTIQIPCEWKDVPTPTPVFDKYLRTLVNADPAVAQLLMEFIGVCISNVKGWRMKKSLFLVGAGDTGKSQLKSLVERMLGSDNFIGIDLKEIEARFGTGAIYGTRLAGSSDMSFMSVDELKTFKKVTGGDSLFAEFKGQQGFQYTYGGLLWFCMNRLPKFGGDDGQWVYNRIMVVNCPNVIPRHKQDKQLLDKMFAERNGIVYKAVMALQTVIANGYRFTEPECVETARQDYRNTNSSVISFAEECLCPWPQGKINNHCTTGRIFKVYTAWCKDNNNGYAKTAKEFREDLAEFYGTSVADMTTRRNGNTYYKNLSLTLESKQQYQREYGYDGTEFLS